MATIVSMGAALIGASSSGVTLSSGLASSILILVVLFWFCVTLVHASQLKFSTRTMMIVITLAAITSSWVGTRYLQAKRTTRISKRLRTTGAIVYHGMMHDVDGWFKTRGGFVLPNWTRRLLGDSFFADVTKIHFVPRSTATDEDLKAISDLPGLRELDIGHTQGTGAAVEALQGMKQLRVLVLRADQLTDEAVRVVETLPQLQRLGLAHPYQVVRDKDLKHIQRFGNVDELQLMGGDISDVAMERIAGMKSLTYLHLINTKVSPSGLRKVSSLTALIGLVIKGDVIDEACLESLAKLKHLTQLALIGTSVPRSRLKLLANHLGRCQVRYSTVAAPNKTRAVRRRR